MVMKRWFPMKLTAKQKLHRQYMRQMDALRQHEKALGRECPGQRRIILQKYESELTAIVAQQLSK
jgi:hypothetical protein